MTCPVVAIVSMRENALIDSTRSPRRISTTVRSLPKRATSTPTTTRP